MFSNSIKQVDVNDILINRETRQRKEITADSVLELAMSIAQSQWISPLLVDEETNHLVAGERRLTAVKLLQASVNGDYSAFTDAAAAREALFPINSCQVKSWNNWTKVPVQFGRNLTPTDLAAFEFIENAQRKDLSWQDKAAAIYEIHSRGLEEDKEWTTTHTANLIGMSRGQLNDYLRAWRQYEHSEDETIKAIVLEATTVRSALQNIDRYSSRREEDGGVNLSTLPGITPKSTTKPTEESLNKKPGPPAGTDVYLGKGLDKPDWSEDEDEPRPTRASLADECLRHADFCEFAATYEGRPFNFLHCDFPYGISFNEGKQAQTVGNKLLGEYDDSADVYWTLLDTLAEHKSRLIAPSAHIMFWFSQNNRQQTEEFFTEMGGIVQPFLMIWHCSDQDGLLPDAQRYGRRTYETAMLVSFGDRKIVAPRALSFAHPRGSKTRIHRSQKPLPVLEHFFEMFVDNASEVLDPTAGSATSVLAAHYQKAKRIVALEKDESNYNNAFKYINTQHSGVSL